MVRFHAGMLSVGERGCHGEAGKENRSVGGPDSIGICCETFGVLVQAAFVFIPPRELGEVRECLFWC